MHTPRGPIAPTGKPFKLLVSTVRHWKNVVMEDEGLFSDNADCIEPDWTWPVIDCQTRPSLGRSIRSKYGISGDRFSASYGGLRGLEGTESSSDSVHC
jgi:hypothetical protein